MENASKALMMAGSILISMMVIGLLVFGYNQLSDVKQTESNIEAIEKLNSYSLRFEKYNRTIYGSELMSLANLQEDYKLTQSDTVEYENVTIKVKVNRVIEANGIIYLQPIEQSIESIYASKDKMEKDIDILGTNKNSNEYKLLVSSYTEFKNKRFKCQHVEYGTNTGRINLMEFIEI